MTVDTTQAHPDGGPTDEPEAPKRTKWFVYTTSADQPCVEVWAEDWTTEGSNGALFTNGDDCVAVFRSGFVMAVLSAEADKQRP